MNKINELLNKYPKISDMKEFKEILWINDNKKEFCYEKNNLDLTFDDIKVASDRLLRFSRFIESAFPETIISKGIIESDIKEINLMKKEVEKLYSKKIDGRFLLKCDSNLPVAGSIKARGGIFEVLTYAEKLALDNNKINISDDYTKFNSKEMREFFSQYKIAVGSTGNLGLSIGIISAKLGFNVTVHMSSDAKQWKKDLLREKGVFVVEYDDDYSKAVEEGRKLSEKDPKSYFIDDENSKNLFLGYSVAALRLKEQLEKNNISVTKENPLFVYLPCGVGGGPGGVAFGLKHIYGDDVHFFFAEPTHSPCMTIGCMTKTHNEFRVNDFGIDNKTIADGLAVGRSSGFVGKTLENLVSGCYTISDENMLKLLCKLKDSENIFLEPSSLASFGIFNFIEEKEFQKYLQINNIKEENITHLMWATGGSMVPQDVMEDDYKKGKILLDSI